MHVLEGFTRAYFAYCDQPRTEKCHLLLCLQSWYDVCIINIFAWTQIRSARVKACITVHLIGCECLFPDGGYIWLSRFAGEFLQGSEGSCMEKRMGHKKRFKKRWIFIPLVLVLILALGTGAYGFSLLNKAKDTVNTKMHEPVKSIDLAETKKKVKVTEPLNVLLLGVDARANDK